MTAFFANASGVTNPGTMCAPSMITSVPSFTARSIKAFTPTDTADTWSRKPTSTASSARVLFTFTTSPVSKDDVYSVGMNSFEKVPFITSRIASVEMTRTIPRRAASCVATVDFPTPVPPPIKMIIGMSRLPTDIHFSYEAA